MVSSMNAGRGKVPLTEASGSESLSALLGERAVNLRQIILRAHRGMNRRISQKFAERGVKEIAPFHLSVLANMNLGETTMRDLAERAQITTNGVCELVSDLVRLGYLKAHAPEGEVEGRVTFTDTGWELMLISFNIQKELETEFRERLHSGDIEQLRRILSAMFDEV